MAETGQRGDAAADERNELTDEYLDRREELWSATTGGKWYRDKGTIRTDRGGDPVGHTGYVTWRGVRGYEPQEVLNNAEWILDAHEAMPLLIAEVRRLKDILAWKEAQQVPKEVRDFAKKFGDGFSFLEE